MKSLEKRGLIFLALLILGFILLCVPEAIAQDPIKAKIIKHDRTEMTVSIEEVGIETIKYRNWNSQFDSPTGPMRNILLKDVFMIVYPDGTTEYPETPKKPETQYEPVYEPKVEPKQKQQQEQQPVLSPESTETKQKKEKSSGESSAKGFVFGGKAGYFIPYDQVISEIYGSGFMGGFLIGYWGEKFGIEFDWRYYSKEGDPYTFGPVQDSYAKLTLSPITLTGYYNLYGSGNLQTYVGLGLGTCIFHEEGSMYSFGQITSGSITEAVFELHTTGGISFKPFYIEISFLAISVPNRGGAAESAGGILISGGLFF